MVEGAPALRVAIVQVPNRTDVAQSFAGIWRALEQAQHNRAALVVFPECALSGFSAQVRERTRASLEPLLEQVAAWAEATGVDVVLPTAWAEGGAVYNTGFVFSGGARQQLFKLRLTPSEQGFFTAPERGPKVFRCHGVAYAVLLCMEAQQPPWTFFAPGEVAFILWPGYWGWTLEDTWSAQKPDGAPDPVFANQHAWQVPLLQANFAFNALDDPRATGPEGLSVVVDAAGRLVARAGHREEGVWLVDLNPAAAGLEVGAVEAAPASP